MKHLFILLVISVATYTAWNMADKHALRAARRAFTRHGVRLLGIVAVLLALVWFATQLPSSSLI